MTKRKGGRPRKKDAMRKRITLWVSEETKKTMERSARNRGMSLSEVIREQFKPESVLQYIPEEEQNLYRRILEAQERMDMEETISLGKKQDELLRKYANYFFEAREKVLPSLFKFYLYVGCMARLYLSSYYHFTQTSQRKEE